MFRLIRFLFKLVLLLAVLGIAVYGYSRYIEPFRLQVEEVSLSSSSIPAGETVTAAVFGDTHFSESFTAKDFARVEEAIRDAKPDLILFLGDLVDHPEASELESLGNDIIGLFSSLEAPLGKYAVYGNHDYGGTMESEYENIMDAAGFQVLRNESVTLNDSNIQLIGVDEVAIGYGDPSCAAVAESEMFTLVLCHEPDLADEVKAFPVDFMISGHTHGRQINISLFDQYILPAYGKKYIKGSYSFDDSPMQLYVNAGIGTTKLPVRLGSPPELTLITVSGTGDNSF